MATTKPVAPGQIMLERYLIRLNLSITEFAEACGTSRTHMSSIINGRQRITPNMADRIASSLGTTITYWLRLQTVWDRHQDQVDAEIARERLAAIERLAAAVELGSERPIPIRDTKHRRTRQAILDAILNRTSIADAVIKSATQPWREA
jgi:addiction module HigA family antidote